jgi:hypothetical protein
MLNLAPHGSFQTLDSLTKSLLGADASAISNVAGIESKSGMGGIACQTREDFGMMIDRGASGNPQFQVAALFSDFLLAEQGEIFLSTKASTDRQKCNRAFAAEFLAPIEGIRERLLSSHCIDRDAVSQVAMEFGVSVPIIRYQLQNQAPELMIET